MTTQDLAFGRINEFQRTFSPHPTAVVSSPSATDCPFCPAIERKTPWYLYDKIHDIVVCQDLNPHDYKLRILVVGSGTRWHEPWDSLLKVHQDLFIALAEAFAAYAITRGHAKALIKIDNIHFSYPNHAHIQCLMA